MSMTDRTGELERLLRAALCAEVELVPRNGVLAVSTPLAFPDGDSLPIYLRPLSTGGIEFTDLGKSLMRLSYEADPSSLREGTRGRVLGQVLGELGLEDRDGEFVLGVPGNDIGQAVFRFSQALTRINDISFLNRVNVESTFYEDLLKDLQSIAGDHRIVQNYVVPTVEKAADYPVDYYIEGGRLPLYVFGVPSNDKARLATIVLQHLLRHGHQFEATVVFKNADDLSRRDVNRLVNVANDIVTTSDSLDDLARKIKHRLVA